MSRLDQIAAAYDAFKSSDFLPAYDEIEMVYGSLGDILALVEAADRWEARLKVFQETEYDREADYQLKLAERDLSDALARLRTQENA